MARIKKGDDTDLFSLLFKKIYKKKNDRNSYQKNCSLDKDTYLCFK